MSCFFDETHPCCSDPLLPAPLSHQEQTNEPDSARWICPTGQHLSNKKNEIKQTPKLQSFMEGDELNFSSDEEAVVEGIDDQNITISVQTDTCGDE